MMNKIRKLKEKKGFTLVELIVVIAIIAILTAVIVPLVGRYSAQATYTTLQDAAKTVSTSANNVISDITMMGSVYSQRIITGSKVNGGAVSLKTFADTAIVVTGNGDAVLMPMGDSPSTPTTPTTPTESTTALDTNLKTKLTSSLQNALPNNAYFAIIVASNTVKGVIYTTDATLGATIVACNTEAKVTAVAHTAVPGFNEAYQSGTTAIGVQGSMIPPATSK